MRAVQAWQPPLSCYHFATQLPGTGRHLGASLSPKMLTSRHAPERVNMGQGEHRILRNSSRRREGQRITTADDVDDRNCSQEIGEQGNRNWDFALG
jgi:hypothetical protein